MPEETGITVKTVWQLAELIGLAVDERRAAELAPQVEAMRENIRTFGEVDLTDVEPMPSPVRRESPGER